MIEAEDTDIAYAMSTTFIIDMFLIILFPIMGQMLGMSDIGYGLWAGTAVNDTSSVVAAGYAFSEAAGDFATMVKLPRTLLIIPTVLAFALIYRSQQAKSQQAGGNQENIKFSKSFPWFILGFLLMSFAQSVGWINGDIAAVLKNISRFLMVVALASIGLKTSLASIKQAGWKPMVFGVIISVSAIIVSLIVIIQMGHL